MATSEQEQPADSHETPAVAPAAATVRTPMSWRKCLAWLAALALLVGIGYPIGRWSYLNYLERECRQALRGKNWENLYRLASRYTAWQPDKAVPWMFRAQAAHELGDLEAAAADLDRMPDRDPRTPEALLERVNLLFGPLNRPLDAEQTCQRALRLNPLLVEGHRRLIYYYAFTLQRKKMVEQIQAAIEWDCDQPETYIYLVSQDWLSFANAYAENTKWMASDPESELFLVARAIYRVTSQALDEKPTEGPAVDGDTDGLPYHEKVLSSYFERFPRNLELVVYYLRQASNAGDADRVAALLEQAPPEAAEDNRVWRYKGWLHDARGEVDLAEQAYRRALQLNPYDYITPHHLAGVLRQKQEKVEMERLEQRYQQGAQLRREVLALPDVTKASPSLLWRIANHAAGCGQEEVAQKLARRLQTVERLR